MQTFIKYKNVNGNSGIAEYKIDGDTIHVRFQHGGVYVYRADDIGILHFKELVRLAEAGEGLNAYINRNRDVAKGWYRKY